MAKTIELQIEKTRALIEGMRNHVNSGNTDLNITQNTVSDMESLLKQLADANDECDRLRAELSPKVKHMNELLASVKAAYAVNKKSIKSYYPQERWPEFGVNDKR